MSEKDYHSTSYQQDEKQDEKQPEPTVDPLSALSPSKHAHLSRLPMYPLQSPETEAAQQEQLAANEFFASHIELGPNQTPAQKLSHDLADPAGGGGFMNKLRTFTVVLIASAAERYTRSVLTRWTTSDGGVLVDVLEHRAPLGVVFYVKSNSDIKVLLKGKHTARLKGGRKAYTFIWNRSGVESCKVVNGEEMEVVVRIERAVSQVEAEALRKGFVKGWVVPSPLEKKCDD